MNACAAHVASVHMPWALLGEAAMNIAQDGCIGCARGACLFLTTRVGADKSKKERRTMLVGASKARDCLQETPTGWFHLFDRKELGYALKGQASITSEKSTDVAHLVAQRRRQALIRVRWTGASLWCPGPLRSFLCSPH
jgi:hypothetical protein